MTTNDTMDVTTEPSPTSGKPILSTDGLTKRFGTLTAVDDVSLEIPTGRITSIIGPNGAGKTTLFNLFTGKYEPTAGRIDFRGNRIDGEKPHYLVKQGLVRSFQITNFFGDLTARENIRLATQAPHTGFGPRDFLTHHRNLDAATESAERILERVDLSHVADETASNLSYGQRRHLEIAISLAADPDLFLMDEPTAGMSPEETGEIVDLIEEIAADITLVLIEHDMHIVMDISDHIAVMNEGTVLAHGTPDQIRNDERVQRAYLGSE
ncbi:ABC transporter ATP-binding protein [Halalkalicoccus jeotgali]|uniref:Probable branched-chain amino acid transport ATP-binding protein LivG n=1 Tax=Halalkalicoccus jeotgali (strain DSM 18796 / CECT 7217 / JCM 14584 / KCTC 4019 / B3) TaxID=795797 RepID=D8JB38_HALJB|nr:ABC transporter ATP-binding protein [Halalkalicoccus jeotgali]ADJ16491.1 ABC transporter related protein [Halalkalicoccus jeotgali B3]ELY41413.1 ABC transporter [Halalkalicoccus jeotgali B3]